MQCMCQQQDRRHNTLQPLDLLPTLSLLLHQYSPFPFFSTNSWTEYIHQEILAKWQPCTTHRVHDIQVTQEWVHDVSASECTHTSSFNSSGRNIRLLKNILLCHVQPFTWIRAVSVPLLQLTVSHKISITGASIPINACYFANWLANWTKSISDQQPWLLYLLTCQLH